MFFSPTISLSAGSGAAIVRPTFSRDFAGEKSLDNGTGPAITFTRASDATYFDATGTLQTAGSNVPRFDHDPATGASRGLLIEGQRSNLLLNSVALSTQTVTVAAVAHTLSFYGTGEVVLSGVHSATVTGAGAFPTRTTLTFTPTAGSLTVTVSGTVEYAQLEAGNFATSYITTTGASATRAADAASVTPISSFYNQAQGTAVIECSFLGLLDTGGTSGVFAFVDSADAVNNFIFARQGTIISGLDYTIRSGGVTSVDSDSITINAGQTYKLGAAFASDDFAAYSDGGGLLTDSSVVLPTVDWLGFYRTFTGVGTSGHIRKIAYWPKRLTNTLLEQLTT
jgi:hypothetical protein